jgi:hypothetical protein
MRHARGYLACVFLALPALAISYGCTQNDLLGTGKENQPPQVWLGSGPPEGSVVAYKLRFWWGGWDPDGEIAYYEYAITDNDGVFDPADTTGADKWHKVFGNDSTFNFTADILADSADAHSTFLKPVDYVHSHSFFIRAVDEKGLSSTRPAYRSFTSRTLSPVVDILVPHSSAGEVTIPPITTFHWVGKDWISNAQEVQKPDSVRWILLHMSRFNNDYDAAIGYIRDHPRAPEWSPWYYYDAPGDSGRSWTTEPLDLGSYVFAVQAKDEAGAVTPVFDQFRNLRKLLVTKRKTGPILRVTNRYMGTIVSSSPTSPPVIVDLLSGIPMNFVFSADASAYGGVASGYRYGWDILDLDDPTQWEVDWTPFVREVNGIPTAQTPPRTWNLDSHTLYIEAIDNSGYISLASITENIYELTMEKDILLIDDYDEAWNAGFAVSSGGAPSDEEHDAFWADMLSDVQGFEPDQDMIEVETELPIVRLANYKTVIWDTYCGYNVQQGLSLLPQMIRFLPIDTTSAGGLKGKLTLNLLAFYLAAGGHVLICGEQPMTAVINQSLPGIRANGLIYPMIFRYELTGDHESPYEDQKIGLSGVGDNSFSYRECCLNVLDISVITNRRLVRRAPNSTCPVGDIRKHSPLDDGLRYAVPAADAPDFPLLELRPEVAAAGKVYAPDKQGLSCDVYNPPYFQTVCDQVAETAPPRPCFHPIYTLGCANTSSIIYGAPIAFWTSAFADRVAGPGGVAARSAVWGFEPVFFKPEQVKQALEVILFDEWKLQRGGRSATAGEE